MIQFANPSALWLLTLIVPLILLYIMKRRRREVIVSSLMLWKQALEDMRAQAPFQKLRSSLLLLLQILILVLVTAILSEPHLLARAGESRRWILAIDSSASMKASDVSPSRFNDAQSQLMKTLNGIPRSDEVLLLSFSSEPSVLQQYTSRRDLIQGRLEAVKPEDVGTRWDQLAKILEPLARETPPPRIVIASDFAGLPDGWQRKIPFDPVVTGASSENAGIVRAAAQSLPEDPQRQALFYQIRNYSQSTKTVSISISIDGAPVDAFEIEIAGGATLDHSADLTVTKPVEVKIQIGPPDVFLTDNEVVLALEKAERISVKMEGENVFLEKAISVLPLVRTDPPGKVAISEIKDVEAIAEPGLYFVEESLNGTACRIVQWQNAHPVFRFVDAAQWRSMRCKSLTLPPGAQLIAESENGPLVYAQHLEGKRFVIVGFSLDDSNLVSLAGFPVFLQNALQWIHEAESEPLPVSTGHSIRNEGYFQHGNKRGYANLMDSFESNIKPQRPSSKSAAETLLSSRRSDLSNWFLILSLGIVMVEWWAFHKRVDV